ncbi:hypothetical protein PJ311_18500 [Bacillus sp. CLL-7-23]|uniref:Uncharacterized protein n=1 Tax=Bacillus changyiensis TaxID=3004103 RepID=A0ABT4X8B9_9BACI|nr:hypothetical protein [Bacillus changyiensis]MDA1477259.1 hypothetical protein [Bacillus changyiensis]MDA7028533.1 hypothetical protein [Bacillus changyiensis]
MEKKKLTYEELEEQLRFTQIKCESYKQELTAAYDTLTNVQTMFKLLDSDYKKLQEEQQLLK